MKQGQRKSVNILPSDTVKDATAFLETFFKLYPTATEKELAYYVKDGVLAPVSGDYAFSELVNPVFTEDGDNLKVSVSVKYLDNKSKMTQISQYELVLHKDDNWKIVEQEKRLAVVETTHSKPKYHIKCISLHFFIS